MASQEVIDSPTRRYISRLADTSEALNTHNSILQKQIIEKEEVLKQRRIRKSGKRVVVGDEVVMSTEKIRSAVAKAEAEAERKQTARKPQKRRHAGLLLGDETEDLIMGSQAEESDIGDCIVVATVAK